MPLGKKLEKNVHFLLYSFASFNDLLVAYVSEVVPFTKWLCLLVQDWRSSSKVVAYMDRGFPRLNLKFLGLFLPHIDIKPLERLLVCFAMSRKGLHLLAGG